MKYLQILIVLVLFGCKKNNEENYIQELTETIQKKYNVIFGNEIELKSIKFVKIDTLTDAQEMDAVSNYSTYGLIKLHKKLKYLDQALDSIKKTDTISIESARNDLKNIFDSVDYYRKIEKNIEKLKRQNIKTGKCQIIFLTQVLDKKTNMLKNDSLFLYIDEKKIIYTQSEFLQKNIKKYYIQPSKKK